MKNYPVSENWHKLHAHRYFARVLNTHLPGAAEEWNANDENRMKKKWLFAGIIKTIYGNLFDYNVSWNDGELSFTPFNNEWWWFSYLKPVRSIMCAYCTIDSTLCVFMPVPKKIDAKKFFFCRFKGEKNPETSVFVRSYHLISMEDGWNSFNIMCEMCSPQISKH